MPQGWAGSQAPSFQLMLCGLCAKDDRAVTAVTMVAGTYTCMEHVKLIPVPTRSPE